MKCDERRILETFLHQSIPYEYKVYNRLHSLTSSTNQVVSYDLMYCFEELFDYAWTALHKPKVHQSIHCNFVGHQSEALSNEFIAYLDGLKKELPILVCYVDVMIDAIRVLQRLISPD